MTIGGHLNDMFASMVAADDLEFKYGMDSPTVRIEGLLVGGGEG
jgi:PmbA protein